MARKLIGLARPKPDETRQEFTKRIISVVGMAVKSKPKPCSRCYVREGGDDVKER